MLVLKTATEIAESEREFQKASLYLTPIGCWSSHQLQLSQNLKNGSTFWKLHWRIFFPLM